MKTFKSLQKSVLDAGKRNAEIYSRKGDCINRLKNNPIGKRLDEVRLTKGKNKFERMDEAIVDGVKWEMFYELNDFNNSFHAITKDGVIVYINFASIGAPHQNAFQILTGIFWNGYTPQSTWKFITTHKDVVRKTFGWKGWERIEVVEIANEIPFDRIEDINPHF